VEREKGLVTEMKYGKGDIVVLVCEEEGNMKVNKWGNEWKVTWEENVWVGKYRFVKMSM
jgi:hypothetical protein